MKRLLPFFLLLSIVFLFRNDLSGQNASANAGKQSLVIGVGNEGMDTYHKLVGFLSSVREVEILNTCESHRVLVVSKPTDFHKDPMDFLEFLRKNIDGLIINFVDETILKKECHDEISKQ